jgi:ribosome-associated protein
MMIIINDQFAISESEVHLTFVRSPGPGGQNVNKVAASSLPEEIKQRILARCASSLTSQGEIVIKASRFRTQETNKKDGFMRLQTVLRAALIVPKKRRPTRPTYASTQRRLTTKKNQSHTKKLRNNKDFE